jgi:hypothetical protein
MKLSLMIFAVSAVTSTFISGCNQHQLQSRDAENSVIAPGESKGNIIRVGDDIDRSRQLLDKYEKHNSIGGFAFAKGPDDIENIFIQLDSNHMNACAWYSKSSNKITRLEVVCFPGRRSGRSTHVWIPIESIELNDDGTHTIKFRKPLTPAELDAIEKKNNENRPKPEYPLGKSGE